MLTGNTTITTSIICNTLIFTFYFYKCSISILCSILVIGLMFHIVKCHVIQVDSRNSYKLFHLNIMFFFTCQVRNINVFQVSIVFFINFLI